jgi:hypothetical protein
MFETFLRLPHAIGRAVLRSLAHVGRFSLLTAELFRRWANGASGCHVP